MLLNRGRFSEARQKRLSNQNAQRLEDQALMAKLKPIIFGIRSAFESAAITNTEYGLINGNKAFGIGQLTVETTKNGTGLCVGFANSCPMDEYTKIIEIEVRLDDQNRELLYFVERGESGAMSLNSISEFKRYCTDIIRNYRHFK